MTGTAQHAGEVGQVIAPQGHLGLIEGASALTAFYAGQMFTKSVGIGLELMFNRGMFATADGSAQHRPFASAPTRNPPTCAPAPSKCVDQTV